MPRLMPAAMISVAALALLAGCANPNIPDFMVEGRLPDFAGKGPAKDRDNVPPPAPAVASAPTPPRAAPAARPIAAPPPEPAPAPTPVQSGVKPVEKGVKAAKTRSKPVKTGPKTVRNAPEPVITGGFSPVTDKATIATISDFAMRAAPNGYLLKSVKSMQGQVVAGMNYELCLRVRTPGHESNWIRQRLVKAVVYQHLDQTLELTSWNEVETCE